MFLRVKSTFKQPQTMFPKPAQSQEQSQTALTQSRALLCRLPYPDTPLLPQQPHSQTDPTRWETCNLQAMILKCMQLENSTKLRKECWSMLGKLRQRHL